MRFPLLFFSRHNTTTSIQHRNLNHLRTLFDGTFKPVRDRGLDHAVEREQNLKPLINLKNLINVEPSKSLPISIIAENRETLKLPFRPIEFIRKYPSVFEEFLPVSRTFQPHIRLTAETLGVDADEKLMYESDGYKEQLANRLLKLLMISRIHKIPLRIIQHLKWDLGLPHDFEKTVIPEFPDCFRVVGDKEHDRVLELVCWSDELAVSVMEKKVLKGKDKGLELVFPVQFSTGFEMDKKYEKWLNEWQRLPYVSPYENASHLSASSDESDRWVVAVLHEILHIVVPKKTEKDNVLILGEWLGLGSRFKKAMLQHPGIFYVSSKIGTYTVVLREGYKRGSLIEQHRLMDLRSQYVHLMNTVKEDSKTSKVVQGKTKNVTKESIDKDNLEERREDGEGSGEEHEGERRESSDAEAEDASEGDFDGNEEKSRRSTRRSAGNSRGREVGRKDLNLKKPLRDSRKRSAGEFTQRTRERREFSDKRSPREAFDGNEEKSRRSTRKTAGNNWGREVERMNLNVKKPLRDLWERSAGKFTQRTREKNPGEISKRIRMLGGRKDVESSHVESSQQRSRPPKSRGRLLNSKKTPV